MKNIFVRILAILGLSSQAFSATDTGKESDNVMLALRMQALMMEPQKIGITPKNYANEIWGILMETGYDNSSITLLVLADGTTSLYFSTGGGIIGAGQHEKVARASANFLGSANKYASEAAPTAEYPLPNRDQVNFYFLSFNGIRKYSASEIDLGEQRDKLSNLFHAGHQVISELREIDQSRAHQQ